MPSPQAHPIHRFGDFELDTMRRLLVSRADGAPVDITGRVLDALIYFVERPGQLVEKKALMEALWPKVIVEDGNLSQTIHTLRKTLGEKPGEHRYIATVPGRGYKFVASVTTEDAGAVSSSPAPAPAAAPAPVLSPAPAGPLAPSRRGKAVLAAVALLLAVLVAVGVVVSRAAHAPAAKPAAAVATPSIAVLPFVDMSAEQDQAHFADGLSEEILNLLAKADNLRVIARTSSFSFKGENVDIRTIASRLNVTHVLEGSVRKSGGRLRITAQLIDAKTSAHVWSDTFDRDVHDVFGVQQEIASAVAENLRVSLARSTPRRAETKSAEAYDHYLQGRLLFSRRSNGDVLQAKGHFEEAVRIDPDYARAWSGLAGCYFVAHYSNSDWPDLVKTWGHAVERAVTLDPELAEAQVRAAQFDGMMGKQDSAGAHLARAKALDPNDPLVLSISMSDALVAGRMEEAIAIQRRIVAVDPLSAAQRGNLGEFLIMVDRLPEAQTELERALELSPASSATATAIADLRLMQGRPYEALGVLSHVTAGPARDGRLALVAYARGDARGGDEILARLQEAAKAPDFDPTVALAIAEIYTAKKDPERAFEWLNRAVPASKREAALRPWWALIEDLQVSPHLKPLHADPRWNELLTTVRSKLN